MLLLSNRPFCLLTFLLVKYRLTYKVNDGHILFRYVCSRVLTLGIQPLSLVLVSTVFTYLNYSHNSGFVRLYLSTTIISKSSNTCRDISLENTKINLMVAPEEELGDHQSHLDSSLANYECLYKIVCHSVYLMLRYFTR